MMLNDVDGYGRWGYSGEDPPGQNIKGVAKESPSKMDALAKQGLVILRYTVP